MSTQTSENPTPVSTYQDWNSGRVDLLTLDQLSTFLGILLDVLVISAAMDQTFPRHRIGEDSIARWRVPDCIEWYEGQRSYSEKRNPAGGPGSN